MSHENYERDARSSDELFARNNAGTRTGAGRTYSAIFEAQYDTVTVYYCMCNINIFVGRMMLHHKS